jgi:hypothetical protein
MQQKNSHNQIKYIEIFRFVQKIFEDFCNNDDIFINFTDCLNSSLRKENFNTLLYEKYFLDIKKCLNILEKEILNGNKLTYISYYRNDIFYNDLYAGDFLKDIFGWLADKGTIDPFAIYPSLKKRELQETPPRTFKQLHIEEKYSYDYVASDNPAKYFQKNKLGQIINQIINNIENNQIPSNKMKEMSQKKFLLNFEKTDWRISSHNKTFLWKLFCSY